MSARSDDGEVSERAMAKLIRRVEILVNSRGWPFDSYIADTYFEGELAEAKLFEFKADGPAVVREAHQGETDDGLPVYEVAARIRGRGEGHWHVSQLSPGDMEVFSGHIEGEEHGGGLLQDVDIETEVRIEIFADYLPDARTWSNVEIGEVAVDDDEAARRAEHHDAIRQRGEER